MINMYGMSSLPADQLVVLPSASSGRAEWSRTATVTCLAELAWLRMLGPSRYVVSHFPGG